MERLIKKIQEMLACYFRITTMVAFVTAIYIPVFWGVDCELDVTLLWQILGVSAICTLGCLVLPDDSDEEEKMSKGELKLRKILLFLYVNIIVLISGFLLEWFYLSNWKMILGMEVCIVFVYTVVMAVSYFANYRIAEKMNQKLREMRNGNSDNI